MRYAETGFNLEIDLTRGNIEKVETDPADTELFLGGLGTNAKILWDRVPPEVEAFSPENLLIIGTGLLCGTPAIGANRTIVSTISPLNQLMAFSMMGGFWAPELKSAGYDKVILRGKSSGLVYLWINDGKVEIRDASHLQGKGAVETQRLIKQELNEPRAQVAAIGLAGENRVFMASIECDRGSASRGGLGAVMGAKGVKAIAVRGTQDIHIARPAEFMKLRKEIWDYVEFREDNPIPETPACNSRLGIPDTIASSDHKWHANLAAWGSHGRIKNYYNESVERAWEESMASMRKRMVSCYNCPMECGATIEPPGQPTYTMKCITMLSWAFVAYSDLEFSLRIAQRTTEYGVDSMTSPYYIARVIELYDDGILSDEDCPGMPENMEGRYYYLLDMIVRREGIGDILANGGFWGPRHPKLAKAFDRTNKRQSGSVSKLGMMNPLYFLMLTTGEKSSITQIQGQIPQIPFSTKKIRESFVKDWFQVPNEKFKKWYVDWESRGKNSYPYYPTDEMCSEWVDWMEMMHYIDDANGVCAGLSSFNQKPAYHLYNYPKIISAGTGIDMDTPKLMQTAKRIRTLVRAINSRNGLRRKDESLPEDTWKKRFPEYEAQLLSTYYKFKGFNEEGIPTKETLEELSLDYVAEDFVRRGILADREGTIKDN